MIRCTALFQLATNQGGTARGGPRLGGWSESWYLDVQPEVARTRFANLCSLRAALLPPSAVIVGQRYQLIGGGSSTGAVRFPGTAGAENDVPQMALLMTAAGAGVPNIRRFSLRGWPDAWVIEGELRPVFVALTALTTWQQRVVSDQFRFRARDLGTTIVKIASISTTGAFVLFEDLTFNVGDFLQIRRAYDQFGRLVSGRYQVATKADARQGTLRLWPPDSSVTNNGTATKYVVSFPLVATNGINISRIVTRKVGRPFEQYRGRSSRRRR